MKKKVRKAVEETFGEAPEEVEEVEEGLMHDTFSVKVGGEEYIVQFSGRDDASLKHNLKCYELFQHTVPVPEPVTKEVREIGGEEYMILAKMTSI